MSKVSFEANPASTAVVETVITPTPVAGVTIESVNTVGPVVNITPVTPSTEVVVRDIPESTIARAESAPLFDDQNIGFEDIILPRINIVQKVGDLSEIFNPGEIVLKQALVIHSPGKAGAAGDAPLNITILGFKKTQFAEKVVGGAMGILAHTEQEIVKHGGTLDYKEWQASEEAAKSGQSKALRLFQRLATCLALVERPATVKDEEHIEFPYECEGKYYALVLWSMKGTAYTHAAKVMFTERKIGTLRSGYSTRSWSLTTKSEKFSDNYAYVPVVRPTTKTSEAFQKFCLTVLGLD